VHELNFKKWFKDKKITSSDRCN